MSTERHYAAADALVVEAWIKGWTIAREVPPPVREAGRFRVEVGWPQQKRRYVFPLLSEDFRLLAGEISDPWIFLKVCAPPEAVRAVLPAQWAIQPPGFMMTCTGPMKNLRDRLPEGYVLQLTEVFPVSIARVLDAQGSLAAIGRIAFVGGHAVYDRIETQEAHRRRGLATAVMRALEKMAAAQGCTCGLLVATAAGRELYEKLGWELHALYTTAVIPGPEEGSVP